MGTYSYKIIAMLTDGQEVSFNLESNEEIEEVTEFYRKQLAEGALSVVGSSECFVFPTDKIINLAIRNINGCQRRWGC